MSGDKFIFALPKGRILEEVQPFLDSVGIVPEPAFYDEKSRLLQFRTNHPDLDIIRVRSFDVATFTAFGAAQMGITGSDALEEFDYSEIYAPVDLNIGLCRLSVAMREQDAVKENPKSWSHIRVATKYPNLTRKHFAARGVQAECIKLNGAMEIAPSLGLARRIVDLVSSGGTLKANGLVEVEKIMDVSSRLIINRTAFKTMPRVMEEWIEKFRAAVKAA
jgi:ATP phosphoribosyltransferase